jgi:methionine sulfoxide reductase heme-binding subunit
MHVIASNTTVWYAARAGGVVAYLLVSASVLAGILLAGKKRVPGFPRFAVEDVHRFLGLLAALFIAIHVGSIALDTVVPFTLTQLVVPFTASYRPVATGLGVVAVELLLAVGVTNRLRRRLPYRVWRRAHYATLAVWLLATVHGILAGTDRNQAWLLWLYALTVALVAGAAALRFGRSALPRRALVTLAVAAGALVAVLGLAALPQRASAPAGGSTAAARATVTEVNGSLTGTIENENTGILSIRGTAARSSAFRIDLLTGDGESVSDSALQLRFPGGSTCEGTLTSLDQTGFTGSCSLPGAGTRTVQAAWTVRDGTVSGTISTSGSTGSASGDA